MSENNENIIVLGAGLAGLGFTQTIPGVQIFESNDYPGGQAFSHEINGCFFDRGAHISHSKNTKFSEMIMNSARNVNQINSCKVSNYWCGQWLTYPIQNNLNELPLEDRIMALTDLITSHLSKNPNISENYKDWCVEQYGQYLTENFYKEFTNKYWRLPMQELAIDWLGGRLIPSVLPNIIKGAFTQHSLQEASFAQFRYPENGGFFGFFKPLFSELNIQFNERAIQIDVNRKEITFASGRKEKYEILASSIPLPNLISAIHDAPSEVKSSAQLLRNTKSLCINLIINKPNLSSNHWCYVYDKDILPARISFPGNLSQNTSKQHITTIQAEIFRRDNEDWNVDSLVEITTKQLSELFNFNINTELNAVSSIIIPNAYIISDHNRKSAVEKVLSWLEQNDIFSMGLYGKWEYIWSDFAYNSGVDTVFKIMERLKNEKRKC
jgi:protoporphyrinogen oxidase